MNGERDAITLPLTYLGLEDIPILFANQFVIQHEKNEFILPVGQLQPPLPLGFVGGKVPVGVTMERPVIGLTGMPFRR